MRRPVHWWVRYFLARAIAIAICEPKVRLGRRRHDGRCDRCEDPFDRYSMERLTFPVDSTEVSTRREGLRSMLGAEYERFCLECSVVIEAQQEADRDA